MQEILLNSIGILGYIVIPIVCGVFISFFAEVMHRLTPSVLKKRYSVLTMTVLISAASAFIFDKYYTGTIEMIIGGVFNLMCAWLFYEIMDKAFAVNIVKKFGRLVTRKIDNV